MTSPDVRVKIAVVPAHERFARSRLFDALEAAYPIRFEGRDQAALRGVDAVYAIGEAGLAATDTAVGVPCLIAVGEEQEAVSRTLVLADDGALSEPLRGGCLTERFANPMRVDVCGPRGGVLATLDEGPIWATFSGPALHQYVAVVPAELREGEALRNRLTGGRCLALLALAQFVRMLTTGRRFEPPRLRAAFVLDDPNLRWPTYGHVRYGALLASAKLHRYHVSIAMVPLDGRFTHPRVVRSFREEAAQLSLCVHGNDHDGPELGRLRSSAEGIATIAQALRRTTAFERRTGLTIDRVMVPPHERLSEAAGAALIKCGFEALCHTRPHPWIASSPDLPWLTRPAETGPLVGWGPAEIQDGGLPLLLRRAWDYPREDLILRAFLGQPLILSGHHDLLRDGPGELEEAAACINRLGDVQWSSLGAIARSAMTTYQLDRVLNVQMLGRRLTVKVPPGVSELRLDLRPIRAAEETALVVMTPGCAPRTIAAVAEARLPIEIAGNFEIQLAGALDPCSVPAPPRRLRPLARRFATECRDRSWPALVRRKP